MAATLFDKRTLVQIGVYIIIVILNRSASSTYC